MTEPEDHELFLPDSGGWSTRAEGLRMRFWRRGDRTVSEHTIPDTYHGPPGMAHGGIVATLLDEISCAAAACSFGWFVFTGELTVRYQHPIPVETPLQWEARVTSATHPRYLVIEAAVQHAGKRSLNEQNLQAARAHLSALTLSIRAPGTGDCPMAGIEQVSYETHLLDGGTYGDPVVGDPIQYDKGPA
jgi:acyl-coenzyme A thioesterase PaaI-like protein